jgi:hypothetical protein
MFKLLINRKVRVVAFWVIMLIKLLFWGWRLTGVVEHDKAPTPTQHSVTIGIVIK